MTVLLRLRAAPARGAIVHRNWIATPAGQPLQVAWRTLVPDHAVIPAILDGAGWQPPAIQRVP